MPTPLTAVPDENVIKVDALFTVKEAGIHLGYKTGDWVYAQIRAGAIEYVNMNPGGIKPKIRIRASTINRIIEEHTFTENSEHSEC